jgi:Tol biopolymer transport system component
VKARLAPLALAALLAAGCGGSEEGDEIAFVSSRDGVYAIYLMNADGAGVHRLTDEELTTGETPSGLFFEFEPAWSPDGTKIAFTSRRGGSFDIYVTGADGTGTRRLTSTRADEANPTWSPDGTRIAYERGNPADLWVMGADGSDQHRFAALDAEEHDPAWSPDGNWIAYQVRRAGTPLAEIHLVRSDASGGRRLTTLGRQSSAPAWSPDSRRIAFATNAGSEGANFDIYTVRVDGKGLRRITNAPEDEFEPSFSPDGRELAFDRAGAVMVTRPGEDVRELTDAENNDGSPVWRPQPEDEPT